MHNGFWNWPQDSLSTLGPRTLGLLTGRPGSVSIPTWELGYGSRLGTRLSSATSGAPRLTQIDVVQAITVDVANRQTVITSRNDPVIQLKTLQPMTQAMNQLLVI